MRQILFLFSHEPHSNITLVEDVVIEFLKQVDLFSFSEEISQTASSQVGGSLSFLSALWLHYTNEEQLAIMFEVVIHMCSKALKQKKESFSTKLLTTAIFLNGLDEEETKLMQSSVIYDRIHVLLGTQVYFKDPALEPKNQIIVNEEDYGYGMV